MNIVNNNRAATRLCAIATYKGSTYITLIIPKLIWVNKRIPIVDASGAALENQSFEIRIKKTRVTKIAETLCE